MASSNELEFLPAMERYEHEVWVRLAAKVNKNVNTPNVMLTATVPGVGRLGARPDTMQRQKEPKEWGLR